MGFALLTSAAIYIYIISSPILTSLYEENAIEVAKTQMSLLDYAASKSSLGATPSQKVKLSLNGGSLIAENSGNWLEINAVLANGTKINIYNDTLGRVIYVKGDTVIGYECGGVWMENLVISPPEFHYVVNTLTFPIIKIANNFSISGQSIEIPIVYQGTVTYYPNKSVSENLVNPIRCDHIEIKLTSDFYKAWAKYFETNADVSVYDENKTIVLELVADWRNQQIQFTYLDEGIPIGKINTSNSTPFSTLIVHLEDLTQNLNLPLYTDTGLYKLGISFKKTGGGNDVNYLVVAFIDNVNDTYESWVSTSPIPWSDDNQDIDLLNNSITMEYTNQLHGVNVYDIQGKNFVNPTVTWGNDINVQEDVNPVTGEFEKGDIKGLGDIIQHYFWVIATKSDTSIRLKKPTGQAYEKGYNEESSRLYFDADTGGGIGFLHVNEHKIKIGFSD